MAVKPPSPQIVRVQGRALAFDDGGLRHAQRTVLLIPGLAANRLMWARQLAPLRAGHRTIALDPRDAGDSDPAPHPYDIAEMANDVVALLDALGIAQADLVGLSMGSFIALTCALRHPTRVGRLVLASTTAGGRQHVLPSWLTSLDIASKRLWLNEPGQRAIAIYRQIVGPAFRHAPTGEWQALQAATRYRPQSWSAYHRQLSACWRFDVSAQMKQIAAPTLIIHGAVDPLIPPINGWRVADALPNAQYRSYANIGHLPPLECAQQFNRDVLAFFNP